MTYVVYLSIPCGWVEQFYCIIGEVFFTTTISVPPGRYLIRYLVDGDWAIDTDKEVVRSLGNEYNNLIVEDPDASDSGASDSDDWDRFDDEDVAQPAEISMTGAFGSSILATALDTSKGKVTITPEMFAAAQQEEKSRCCGSVDQMTNILLTLAPFDNVVRTH